jgi:arsenate reductase
MNILFLCVANSARSQIAEGLARKLFGPRANIQSAGSAPSGKVNPNAVAVLQELEIDASNYESKPAEDLPPEFFRELDYVITLCAEEICPTTVSGARKLNWGMPDPAVFTGDAEAVLAEFRKTRDSISAKLTEFGGMIGLIPPNRA